MSILAPPQAESARPVVNVTCWRAASRFAFRFCVLYFGLTCLLSQILGALIPIPTMEFPDPGVLPPFREMVIWTAKHVFGYKQPLVYIGSGSGDKVYDWVLVFCVLVIALIGTCIWSALDRKRANYNTLYKWFRVFLRFALAGQMFTYGLVKIFPMQMQFPRLAALLEPYGNFSPMGVLWESIGASPGYERFVGSAELLGGLLLIIPATSMLGALICLVDMTEVFVLNMTYDVPVKLLSFHLILMAAFLLIPERVRFVSFCFRNCAIEARKATELFASGRANRSATAAQIIFGLLLLGSGVYGISRDWYRWGGGAPKSALYGIWNVDEMRVDDVVRPPLLTDLGRWRRIVLENPNWAEFQKMDDSFAFFGMNFDAKSGTVTLTKPGNQRWKSRLMVRRHGAAGMHLEGQMGPDRVSMQLSLMDRNHFLLVSRGFHWVQDYPFNR